MTGQKKKKEKKKTRKNGDFDRIRSCICYYVCNRNLRKLEQNYGHFEYYNYTISTKKRHQLLNKGIIKAIMSYYLQVYGL